MNRYSIVTAFVILMLARVLIGWFGPPDKLVFINGQIHTIGPTNDVVQAMVVESGRIKALGRNDQIQSQLSLGDQLIDLKGHVVLPGFVDAHSHFPASGIRAISTDLSPPPIGGTGNLDALLAKIQQAASGEEDDAWILGYNYDNTAFSTGEHPTRAQLDSVVPDQPVYLWHSSGHMGVANSKALEALGITDGDAAPFGGSYGKDKLSGKLNGLLQEKAAPPLSKIISEYSYKDQLKILTSARDEYLAAGVTTVQNGYAGKGQMRMLQVAQWFGLLDQRVVVWPAVQKNAVGESPEQNSNLNFKRGALKIIVDGSPQGLTAHLSEPYFKTTTQGPEYRGYSLITPSKLTEIVSKYHREGFQLALHGNGDQAIENIILAIESAQAELPRPDARHILTHAQTIRHDQVKRLKAAGISPSFFNSHVYYWGDWHRQQSLGPERAQNISPLKWTQDARVLFTLHSDAPVTPINPMQLLWSASNRETQSGFVLGETQQIDTTSALRALTIDAAWQSQFEDQIGSLEVGKLADMIVLSQSPFEAKDVRQIKVLTTFIDGVKRYGELP